MAADAFGIEVPADSDAFDPSGDMRDMGASLHVRTVVPVVNATARDALVVVAGQLVNRLDTGNLERWDGADWQVLPVGATDWTPLTVYTSTYEVPSWAYPPTAKKEGNEVKLSGVVQRISGNMSANFTPLGLPDSSWLPPSGRQVHMVASGQSGAIVRVRIQFDVSPISLIVHADSSSPWLGLDGLSYRIG